jgi:hypothetical protein
MIDAATQAFVQNLIRQLGRSMLQYVTESFPWTTPANHALLKDLAAMALEERHMAGELTKLLLRHHGRAPFLGAYPMSFTTINFVALDHLLPRLVSFEEARVADLESEVERILHEETRSVVRSLLDMSRRHLARLKDLAAGKGSIEPAPTPAVLSASAH